MAELGFGQKCGHFGGFHAPSEMEGVAGTRPGNWEEWGENSGDLGFVQHLERRYSNCIPFNPSDVPEYPPPHSFYAHTQLVPLFMAVRGTRPMRSLIPSSTPASGIPYGHLFTAEELGATQSSPFCQVPQTHNFRHPQHDACLDSKLWMESR